MTALRFLRDLASVLFIALALYAGAWTFLALGNAMDGRPNTQRAALP